MFRYSGAITHDVLNKVSNTLSNGYFMNNTVIPNTFLCLYFHTNKLAPMASTEFVKPASKSEYVVFLLQILESICYVSLMKLAAC